MASSCITSGANLMNIKVMDNSHYKHQYTGYTACKNHLKISLCIVN